MSGREVAVAKTRFGDAADDVADVRKRFNTFALVEADCPTAGEASEWADERKAGCERWAVMLYEGRGRLERSD